MLIKEWDWEIAMAISARDASRETEKRINEYWAAVVAEKDAIIAEKDAMIAEKDAMIAELDAIIAELDAKIAEKEAEIAALDAKLDRAAQKNRQRNQVRDMIDDA